MKLDFIISLLLFVLVISEIEYDLDDGIEKTITDVKVSEYSFWIKASKPNLVRFSLSFPISPYFVSMQLDYYEYTERNSISPNQKSGELLYRHQVNNKPLIYFSYYISSSSTNYVKFKVKLDSKFNYMNARIDLLYSQYNLYHNKPLDIYNLASNNGYYIYFELFENPIVNISLTINNTTKEPFSGINIHELETSNGFPSIDITYQSISFIPYYSSLKASFSYSIKYPRITKYIALKIKPSLDIQKINIINNNPLIIIDLRNDFWKDVYNLKNNEKYLFFIEATQGAKANISFIAFDTDNHPFNYLSIYEYEKKDNTYSYFLMRTIKNIYKIKDSDFMTPISYTVYSSKTRYLAFLIEPNYNIEYIRTKTSISGCSYLLYNDTSNYISNLESGNDYFFFIKTKQYDIVNLTLTMNNLANPFSYIYYQELSKREDINNNFEKIQSISEIKKGNQLIISISKNISEYSTHYLTFKFSPSYNIDNMTVEINIHQCIFNLRHWGDPKINIYNLKSNIIYYIRLNIMIYHFTNLNLTVYNGKRNPFSYIRIYECKSLYRPLYFCERITTNNYPVFNRQNNQNKIIFKFNSTSDPYYDVIIEIRPNYDISYMLAEYEYIYTREQYSESNFGLIILIIISTIIIITIIIIFIIWKCKRSKLSNPIESEESPLYPNNKKELMN